MPHFGVLLSTSVIAAYFPGGTAHQDISDDSGRKGYENAFLSVFEQSVLCTSLGTEGYCLTHTALDSVQSSVRE